MILVPVSESLEWYWPRSPDRADGVAAWAGKTVKDELSTVYDTEGPESCWLAECVLIAWHTTHIRTALIAGAGATYGRPRRLDRIRTFCTVGSCLVAATASGRTDAYLAVLIGGSAAADGPIRRVIGLAFTGSTGVWVGTGRIALISAGCPSRFVRLWQACSGAIA